MASKQDVIDAIERERQQVVDALTAANTAQDALVTDLKAQITALKDAAAAGTAMTPADFDALVTAVDGIYNPPTPVLPAPVAAP